MLSLSLPPSLSPSLPPAILQESSCFRSCWPKALVLIIFFFVLMVVGEVTVLALFTPALLRITPSNSTRCDDQVVACFVVRTVRSVGVYGFFSKSPLHVAVTI